MKTAITMLMALVLAAGPLYAQDADQPPPTPGEEQPEVLTSGPVHEAFAEPVNLEPQAGLVAPEEPPATMTEVPPDEKPQGDQYVWVPGYWAWDEGRHGYIWVSACWRAAPPKMYWVPGYWSRVAGGWEWIPGFWAPVANQRIEYLPTPPAIASVEPPGPPPSPDDIWAPPCQYWYEGHYILRPGYWVHAQPGWIWVPSHYVLTPRGYVFVMGHWDYALERRGVLFAPVYVPRHVRVRPGFSYRLSVVIDLGVLRVNLFTYPRYSHYCFGDYYDDAFLRIGIYPRCEVERRHIWYDPIYEHDRWRHIRTDPHWVENERHQYDLRRADKNLRPPRTYREMEAREAKLPEAQHGNVRMAQPLSTVAARRVGPMKFEPVKSSEQRRITRETSDMDKFREQRNRWETPDTNPKSVRGLPEPKDAAMPSVERKERASAPTERKESAPAPAERKGSTPGPAAKPTERQGPPAASTERASAPATPREIKMTKPETVRIPRPPIIGPSAGSSRQETSPPPKPDDERKSERDARGKDRGKRR